MFVVFLGNKLISCDSIVPLVLELHQRQPKRPIWFYCRDPKTLKIIEQNIVLYDAITSMGRLMPVVTRKPRPVSPFVRRIRSLAVFAWILLNAFVRGASFIHFGEMHNRPFRWLYRLWPQRTYLVETPHAREDLARKQEEACRGYRAVVESPCSEISRVIQRHFVEHAARECPDPVNEEHANCVRA